MTRHGWYEWRPDTRDERLDLLDVIRETNERALALWCDLCERYEGPEGCPACGSEQ